MPGMPSTLSHWVMVPTRRSTFTRPLRLIWSCGISMYSCTPSVPYTVSPTANCGFFEATTRPMPPARITSSMATGGM
ncbi:hypothetical protein D3C87_957530 [compost metagenome]